MKTYTYFTLLIFGLLLAVVGCKKLDLPSKQSVVIPKTLQDFQGLMDNSDQMNNNYPVLGEIGADSYYLEQSTYDNLFTPQHKAAYTWKKDLFSGLTLEPDWDYSFNKVFYANVVLDGLKDIQIDNLNTNDYNNVKGQALFHRAIMFYSVAQEFCKQYVASSAKNDLGVPLRLSSDLNIKSVRASLEDAYQQVISDLKEAIALLPNSAKYKSRPSKAAAYALLARVYLQMGNYGDALLNSEASLKLYNSLIDYNSLDATAAFPIPKLGAEEIFHAEFVTQIFFPNSAIIMPKLYDSYSENDLRKTILFQPLSAGKYTFKGNYNSNGILYFAGIATDEIYLINAECKARKGDVSGAMDELNALLITRYKTGLFVPLTASNTEEALKFIIQEREKELLFRGVRWSDLKRLNLEPAFAVNQSRTINGTTVTLPANDSRYTYQIPGYVITLSGIQQNN